jgi:ribosome-associated protein
MRNAPAHPRVGVILGEQVKGEGSREKKAGVSSHVACKHLTLNSLFRDDNEASFVHTHTMPRINDDLTIDDDELRFEFSRSSGPGGQNVNKVETKVRLLFDVGGSKSLGSAQRARIMERLSTRITRDGVLHVTSQRHRSREANRKAAIDRFIELLADALEEDTPRVPTGVPKGAKRRRLESKRRRSRKKALRTPPDEEW